MKRFLKVFVLLMVSLFLLVSGVDAGLDHFSRTIAPSSYALYNENGDVLTAYTGDLSLCHPYIKRTSVTPLVMVHRS